MNNLGFIWWSNQPFRPTAGWGRDPKVPTRGDQNDEFQDNINNNLLHNFCLFSLKELIIQQKLQTKINHLFYRISVRLSIICAGICVCFLSFPWGLFVFHPFLSLLICTIFTSHLLIILNRYLCVGVCVCVSLPVTNVIYTRILEARMNIKYIV